MLKQTNLAAFAVLQNQVKGQVFNALTNKW